MYAQDNDEELVLKSLSGDTKAFEKLVEKHHSYVFNLLLGMGCLPEDAKGITQGVFIQAYYSLPNFKRQAKFRTWIHRIAVNRCYNWFKKNKVSTTVVPEDLPDDKNTSPEERILEDESLQEVKNAMLQLPEKYRTVLNMFYYEKMSYAEIAAQLNLNKRTIETRLYRARHKLKDILEKNVNVSK